MTGYVDFALPVGDHHDIAFGQSVLNTTNRKLVTRDLPAREQDNVA